MLKNNIFYAAGLQKAFAKTDKFMFFFLAFVWVWKNPNWACYNFAHLNFAQNSNENMWNYPLSCPRLLATLE